MRVLQRSVVSTKLGGKSGLEVRSVYLSGISAPFGNRRLGRAVLGRLLLHGLGERNEHDLLL